ncbi:copper chaperone of lysine biosynthesis protein [Apiotrichum porosum]|uniref:holo-[acyl-carrier-protein] synthase n=1 Tax=Apiotrichum porosum TaxID=105984 RepID=A0A427XHU1_9TREE|nr:copper chaperone of lysine biosynthesis protein [Apiotrichum porosum]RSH78418.1 copper chaperone of lysine biosynthesis protein [Apiotrichum porosum]
MRLFALKVPPTVPEDTFDRLLHHIPETAHARVRKFRHEADAILDLLGSLAGRLLPTWYLRESGLVPPPTHPQFKHKSRGKPYLSSPVLARALDFNTSHEGAYVLLAVVEGDGDGSGPEVDVGVDVMDLPTDPDELYDSISYQLTLPERLAVAGTSGKVKAKLLTTLWTIKEGFTKATGDGISFGLDRIEVDMGDGAVAGVKVDGKDIRQEGWTWAVGSIDGGDYGWAVIWRGEATRPAGPVVLETIRWDDFVKAFIGSPSHNIA